MDVKLSSLKLRFLLCMFLTFFSNISAVIAGSSQIGWLDVAKSRWVVSGEVSDIKPIEKAKYFEITLSKVNFLKGENYADEIRIRSSLSRLPIFNQNKGKRVVVMLDYHRVHKMMDIVTRRGVYGETEEELKYLVGLIQFENRAMMNWTGFNETKKLETPRGLIHQAIKFLSNKNKFSEGVSTLFELPHSDLGFLIYEMSDLTDVAQSEVSFEFLKDDSESNSKTCAVRVVFDVIDCILKRRLSYSPYPSVSSQLELEYRWIKYKGWLTVASKLKM